ncbi:cytochrome P450 [Stagonosporopsis vannaccii]|nr:cytochrome P450 [Stagonosporopsis vannaccii]
MKKFSDEYNGLFSLTLGGETHIWIAREDIAQDLLVKNAAISSSRADLGAYPGVINDHKYLPLIGYTETFHRQKNFAHSMASWGVTNKFYGYINLETKRLMHELIHNPSNWWHAVHLHCARISARLAYGSPELAQEHVANAGVFINQLGPSGPAPNLAPFLAHFPEWLVPGKKEVRIRQEREAELWVREFEQTKNLPQDNKQAMSYVAASLQTKSIAATKNAVFENEEEARCAVGMLCTVSIYTIAGPATLFVMAMILHPSWQEKVRAQIDKVVGTGMVDLSHAPQLPILRAAIKECVRWKSTVPLGVPRLLTSNYTYDNYHFPAGAVVHVLDIALSQDPERYSDPSEYNPDRWLNPSSSNYRAPLTEYPRLKGHHIFGRGRRVCPGQDLAEAELIVFCGNLLRFFSLGPKTEDGVANWPDPEKWTTDVIGGPLPFECEITVRDGVRLGEVERLFKEAFPQG